MTDKQLKPEDVRTPATLRTFFNMVEQEASDIAATVPVTDNPERDSSQQLYVKTLKRVQGLAWGIHRVIDLLEDQAARIAELESTNKGDGK